MTSHERLLTGLNKRHINKSAQRSSCSLEKGNLVLIPTGSSYFCDWGSTCPKRTLSPMGCALGVRDGASCTPSPTIASAPALCLVSDPRVAAMSLQASLEEQILSALPDVQGNLARGACACQGWLALGLFSSSFFPYSSSPTCG